MGYQPVVVVGASLGFTAEAVLATTPTVSSAPVGGQGNYISGVVAGTGNASASTVTLRVRQNSLTGTVVYTSPAVTVGAAGVFSIPFAALDTAAASAGVANYVVTATASLAATATVATASVQNVGDQD